MSQFSFCWSCTPVGDGGPTSFSVEVVEMMNRFSGNVSPLDSGVVYWLDDTVLPGFTNPVGGTPEEFFFLNPTEGLPGDIIIQPGVGLVQGWFFICDELEIFTIAGGNPNATDVIGLRRDLPTQTVRLFHGQGAAGTPYSLVQTATTWEIALVEIDLDGSGDFLFNDIRDVRKFVGTPFYPVQAHSIFYHTTHGWVNNSTMTGVGSAATYNSGSPAKQITSFMADIPNVGFYPGVTIPDAVASTTVYQFVQVPEDMVGGEVNFEFMIYDFGYDAVNAMQGILGYIRESDPNVSVNGGVAGGGVAPIAFPIATSEINLVDHFTQYGVNVPCDPGEVLCLYLVRRGGIVGDYTSTVLPVVTGVRLHYNKAVAPNWHTELPLR